VLGWYPEGHQNSGGSSFRDGIYGVSGAGWVIPWPEGRKGAGKAESRADNGLKSDYAADSMICSLFSFSVSLAFW
jgi:hypothetical protein